MVRLSKEVEQNLKRAMPLIVFFGLPHESQMLLLPTLQVERKYDFPDGDLITSNALEVLTNGYKACLNSLAIRLMVILEESGGADLEPLANLVDQLLATNCQISEEPFTAATYQDFSNAPEWENLRQLSLSLQRMLNIYLEIDQSTMEQAIDFWLHA